MTRVSLQPWSSSNGVDLMLHAYRVVDIRAAEDAHGGDLMSHAAFAIASRACDLLTDLAGRVYGSTILLLVGPGGNGGDALYAGAHLAGRGAQVFGICTHERWHEQAMDAFIRAGGRLLTTTEHLNLDLILDGIYGMGTRGAVDARWVTLASDAFVLSIDLPSGVDADTGQTSGAFIEADLTMATGALKAAHLIDPARSACGVIEVIDLGLDLSTPQVRSWQRVDVADALEKVAIDPQISDKYRQGVVALLAGSDTYPGAGRLAAGSAIAMGAGMIRHLSGVDLRAELPEIVAVDGQSNALAIGPGLMPEHEGAARELLSRDLPAVVDAGAIAWVPAQRPRTIITPHAGELARLLGVERSDVEARRLEHVRMATERLGVAVLLKGSTTIISSASGEVAVNPTGSSALATAGSGDVLTGMIGALVSRGMEVTDAAIAAAWIHGLAGAYAQSGASGIIEMIPAALAAVREGDADVE